MRRLFSLLYCLALGYESLASAFVVRQSNARSPTAHQAEFREYVPLIVSGAVIVDILLGSPFVNAVMSFARPKEETEANEREGSAEDLLASKNERIDSKKVAADAVERAKNVLELRQMLEDNKSDWDRIKDMQRKVEQQQSEFDRRS